MVIYLFILIVCGLLLGAEYWSLTHNPSTSVLVLMQKLGYLASDFNLSLEPGRPISLWLGWLGLGFMLAMNVYSMRKRFDFLRGAGRLQAWLNFHIFCGLIGPLFILFHSNFKVRGLVAISFWSMVVSFSSGVIGRYFFVQLLHRQSDRDKISEQILAKLDSILTKSGITPESDLKESYLRRSLAFSGAQESGLIGAFLSSIVGDFRMAFSRTRLAPAWPAIADDYLRAYALNRRQTMFTRHFQRLMGYWHAFHFPFAVFMYAAALIHVIAAQIFGV